MLAVHGDDIWTANGEHSTYSFRIIIILFRRVFPRLFKWRTHVFGETSGGVFEYILRDLYINSHISSFIVESYGISRIFYIWIFKTHSLWKIIEYIYIYIWGDLTRDHIVMVIIEETGQTDFKSVTMSFVFHITLTHWWKVCIQIFSLQL